MVHYGGIGARGKGGMVVTIRTFVDALGRGSWDSHVEVARMLAALTVFLVYHGDVLALDMPVHFDISALFGEGGEQHDAGKESRGG